MATVASAASGYLILVLAARNLRPAENAEFLVFWSVLFGLFGVLGGVQQEATRAVGTARLDVPSPPAGATALEPRRRRVHVLPVALTIGLSLATLVVLTAPWWRPAVLGGNSPTQLLALCLAAVAYAGHCAVLGSLAGARAWGTSAAVMGAEALVRLLFVVAAVLAGGSVVGLNVAIAAAAGTWLIVLSMSRRVRHGATAHGDATARQLTRRMLTAMVASTASAALVVGYPALLRTTATDEVWATAAPLVLAISMTRAPLLMPLNAFQGVAITHFLRHRDRGMAAHLPILGAIAAVGVVGAALAAAFGPWLMTAIFGDAYHISGSVLAGLTLAAVSLAMLTMTGSAVLALGKHTTYAGGWVVAIAGTGALLLLDVPLDVRAVLSLGLGPLAGIAVHLWAVGAPPQPHSRRTEYGRS